MRRFFLFSRILTLLLSLQMALPSPSYALRNLQPKDNAGLEQELTEELNPPAVGLSAANPLAYGPADDFMAGLEGDLAKVRVILPPELEEESEEAWIDLDGLIDLFPQLVSDIPGGGDLLEQFKSQIEPFRGDLDGFLNFLSGKDAPMGFQAKVRPAVAAHFNLSESRILFISPQERFLWRFLLQDRIPGGLYISLSDSEGRLEPLILILNVLDDFDSLKALVHEGAHHQREMKHPPDELYPLLFILIEALQAILEKKALVHLAQPGSPISSEVHQAVEQAYNSPEERSYRSSRGIKEEEDLAKRLSFLLFNSPRAGYEPHRILLRLLFDRVKGKPTEESLKRGDIDVVQLRDDLGPERFDALKNFLRRWFDSERLGGLLVGSEPGTGIAAFLGGLLILRPEHYLSEWTSRPLEFVQVLEQSLEGVSEEETDPWPRLAEGHDLTEPVWDLGTLAESYVQSRINREELLAELLRRVSIPPTDPGETESPAAGLETPFATPVDFTGEEMDSLRDWLNENGLIEWDAGSRYGTAKAQLGMIKKLPFHTVQVYPDRDWVARFPEVKKALRFNIGSWFDAEFGSFGQILIGRYRFQDGTRVLIITEIQPGGGYRRGLSRTRRGHLDPWRRHAIEKIAEWAHAQGFQVYLIHPEVIQQLYPNMSPQEVNTSYKKPVAAEKWTPLRFRAQISPHTEWEYQFSSEEVLPWLAYRVPVQAGLEGGGEKEELERIEAYARYAEDTLGPTQRLIEMMRDAGLRPGQMVAEIGSGTGAGSRLLAEVVGDDGWVIAFDRSPAMVAYAKEQASADPSLPIVYREGEAQNIASVVTEEVNAIAAFNVVNELDDKDLRGSLEAWYDKLPPGGLLALNTGFFLGAAPEPSSAFSLQVIATARAIARERYSQEDIPFPQAPPRFKRSPSGYQTLLKEIGFRELGVENVAQEMDTETYKALWRLPGASSWVLPSFIPLAEREQILDEAIDQVVGKEGITAFPRTWLNLVAQKPAAGLEGSAEDSEGVSVEEGIRQFALALGIPDASTRLEDPSDRGELALGGLVQLELERKQQMDEVVSMLRQVHSGDPNSWIQNEALRALLDVEPIFELTKKLWADVEAVGRPTDREKAFREVASKLQQQSAFWSNRKSSSQKLWRYYRWILYRALRSEPDLLASYNYAVFLAQRVRQDWNTEDASEAERAYLVEILQFLRERLTDQRRRVGAATLIRELNALQPPPTQAGLEQGGVLFNGLTAVGGDGQIVLALDVLPEAVVLFGLAAGKTRLVLPETDSTVEGMIYLGPGIRLSPAVVEAVEPERIVHLPGTSKDSLAFLTAELHAGRSGLVLLSVPSGAERGWVPASVGVVNLPGELAPQLTLTQLAGLEEAVRKHGGILWINGILQRQWEEPMVVLDLAA